jgi:cbb3-type cytochrome oxidase subunit 3
MQVADSVFSISLALFLALVTLYLLRKSRELTRRLQSLAEAQPARMPALRVASVELLGRGSMRMAALMALSLARWVVPAVVLYAYLVVVSSLFASTRGYAERLTGWVLVPLAELVSRLASTLPVLVIVLFLALVTWMALRASQQFFESVARGEASVVWIDREIARTVGALVRVGIVVMGLVFAAPLITGNETGAFAKLGTYLLVALALASTPILASASVGAVLVLRHHVRLGDEVSIGKHRGSVQHFGLTDKVLRRGADSVRVPYLLALVVPLAIHPSDCLVVELNVAASAPQALALAALERAIGEISQQGRVLLVRLDGDRAHYCITLPMGDSGELRQRVLLGASEALLRAGLGPPRSDGQPAP